LTEIADIVDLICGGESKSLQSAAHVASVDQHMRASRIPTAAC